MAELITLWKLINNKEYLPIIGLSGKYVALHLHKHTCVPKDINGFLGVFWPLTKDHAFRMLLGMTAGRKVKKYGPCFLFHHRNDVRFIYRSNVGLITTFPTLVISTFHESHLCIEYFVIHCTVGYLWIRVSLLFCILLAWACFLTQVPVMSHLYLLPLLGEGSTKVAIRTENGISCL